MDSLSARLKNARKANKLTQRELATLTGMDQGHISRLETGGKGVSTEHLQALAKAFGTTLSHLLGEDMKISANDYKDSAGSAALHVDDEAPAGLRQLASDSVLSDALNVTEAEWETLDSIQLPGEVNKDGYVQLLITIRAITGNR